MRFSDPNGRGLRDDLQDRRDDCRSGRADCSGPTPWQMVEVLIRNDKYGGPDWTAGRWYGTDYSVPAKNPADQAYKEHDQAYDACIEAGGQVGCYLKADEDLVEKLRVVDLSDYSVHDSMYATAALAFFDAKILRERWQVFLIWFAKGKEGQRTAKDTKYLDEQRDLQRKREDVKETHDDQ